MMAISPGLAWSLANGISQQEYDQSIFNAIKQGEAQGLTDANFRSQMTQYGISAEDVARVTQAAPSVIQQRFADATPTTAADIAFNQTAMNELAGREADWAQQQQQNVITNNENIARNETDWAQQQQKNTVDWAAQQKANEAAWALQQKANEEAWAAQQQTRPFAYTPPSALDQNFRNYTSIPIGAQYNPGVTAGGASPYSQVMGQMSPVGNPYANFMSGQIMGGYDPGLYERQRLANIELRDSGINPYDGPLNLLGYGGDSADAADGGFGFGGDGTGNAAAAAAAAGSSAGADGGPGGVGIGEGGGTGMGGWAKGGLVNRVAGPNPAGPDDGYGKLQVGEYVIKKSSVNKYGQGLLDMINDGKIPAKKMKSLLG
jgi:hypothetical protein